MSDRLRFPLSGYLRSGESFHRNVLFEQLLTTLPADPTVKVQIYNAEIAPGGYTNWHRHNGTTFFIALQGTFEAHASDGVLIRASAGDVYSEPAGKVHRGYNPHSELPYLCIGVAITPADLDHVTAVSSPS